MGVISKLNLEQHLSLVNLATFHQKTFSNHRKGKIHPEKSSPIHAEAVGVEVVENNKLFSDRVCNPCARKIRNLGTLYELVQSSIGNQAAACKTPPKQSIHASKRLLETPPGSSPCRKTVRVNSPVLQKASRKSLQFAAEQSQQALKDRIESRLNIDHLPDDGGLQVKVVIVDSTGKPITRIPHEEESKQILKHKKLKPEVVKALRKNVSEEVASYTKSESILLLNEPDEIASFSNTIFLEVVRVFCPVFYEFVVGASGQDDQEMKKAGIGTNGVAFAAATLCRVRSLSSSLPNIDGVIPEWHKTRGSYST